MSTQAARKNGLPVSPRTEPKPMSVLRQEVVAGLGEFFGTFSFLFMAFGAVQVTSYASDASDSERNLVPKVFFISAAFGTSLAVNAWIFYRVSGSIFNPALVVGLLVAQAIKPLRAAHVVVLQIVAGICAAAAIDAVTPGPLRVSNSLGVGVSITQGLFIEMFLTAQLMMAVLFLAVEKQKATFLAPLGIGASLFVGHTVGIALTGAGLNPARSFGPEVISGFPPYAWIYWLGPCLGSCLAAVIYRLLKMLQYPLVNPTQDFDDLEMLAFRTLAADQTTDNDTQHHNREYHIPDSGVGPSSANQPATAGQTTFKPKEPADGVAQAV